MNAVAVMDVNGDQKSDLIIGGNQFGFLPQFGRLDANYGLVLLNKGKRQWEVMEDKQSGLSIKCGGDWHFRRVMGNLQC